MAPPSYSPLIPRASWDAEPEYLLSGLDHHQETRRQRRVIMITGLCGLLLLNSLVLFVLWIVFATLVTTRWGPISASNGLENIVQMWQQPSDIYTAPRSWWENFSSDVIPVPCHSHNDYMRRVPLFEALAAGCISVETDLWLEDKPAKDAYVAHSRHALQPANTLQSLYLEPLALALTQQNRHVQGMMPADNTEAQSVGLFDNSPRTSLVLLLHLKSNGTTMWPIIQSQLQHLRDQGWLTFWDSGSGSINWRPLTVVVSGDQALFELAVANATYRDVFYDNSMQVEAANGRYTAQDLVYTRLSWRHTLEYLTPSSRHLIATQHRQKSHSNSTTEKVMTSSKNWHKVFWPEALRKCVSKVPILSRISFFKVEETWTGR